MAINLFSTIFRRRPSNAAAITELTSNVDALFTRINIMRRNLQHAQARATLLEGRSRGLVATISEQAQTIQSLRAQLEAARSLIDRRTVALRVAEEAWAAESQRVMDLEDEARWWITRARENCVVSEN